MWVTRPCDRSLLARRPLKDADPSTAPRCRHCSYPLAGLPESGPCPECGTTIIPEPPPRIALRCIRCGYDLAGLPESGTCPECASPIERSMQGNLLRFASPDYVRTLRRGATLVFVASLLYVFSFIPVLAITVLLAMADAKLPHAVESAVDIATLSAMLFGWWTLSTPDPGFVGTDNSRNWRLWLRWVLPFASLVILAHAVLPVWFAPELRATTTIGAGPATFSLSYGEMIQWLARLSHACAIFCGLRYVRWLSYRIPSVKCHKESTDASVCMGIVIMLLLAGVFFGVLGRYAGWLFILTATAMLSALVTFLVWLVTYFVLLGRLRHELARVVVIAEALSNAAPPLVMHPPVQPGSIGADSIHPPPITQSGSDAS